VKTARCIVDGTFRALYRDARKVDRFVADDPFADLSWPRQIVPSPDPFTADERDQLLAYFWDRKRYYYPFVYTMFFTGLRTAEAVGLRWGDVDLRRGELEVRRSRTLGEDNAPKTEKSARAVRLRPEVVAVLRAARPIGAAEDTFVFTTQHGTPLDEERFVEKHWRPAIRKTKVRPRKFYATRHTFISLTLMGGVVNIKRVADYCGTSVAMVEKHYARWMADDTPEEVAALGGTAPQTKPLAAVVG